MSEPSREQPRRPRHPHDRAAIRHCIILTLVALIAIAVSIALPPDEQQAPQRGYPAGTASADHASSASGSD